MNDMKTITPWCPWGRTGQRRHGFTLVELLAVTMVMAILAGIVIGIARYASRKADESKAQATILKIENALENFRAERGFYPPLNNWNNNSRLIEVLFQEPRDSGRRVYLNLTGSELADDGQLLDPWGRPYRYRGGEYAIERPDSYDLQSDGVGGDVPPITNWNQ